MTFGTNSVSPSLFHPINSKFKLSKSKEKVPVLVRTFLLINYILGEILYLAFGKIRWRINDSVNQIVEVGGRRCPRESKGTKGRRSSHLSNGFRIFLFLFSLILNVILSEIE